MFIASLLCVGLIGATACGVFAPRRAAIVAGLFLLWLPACWVVGFVVLHAAGMPPAIEWMWPLTVVVFAIAHWRNVPRRWYPLCAAGCALASYGLALTYYVPVFHEHQRLAAKYPLIDLKPRLADEPENAAVWTPSYEVWEHAPSPTSELGLQVQDHNGRHRGSWHRGFVFASLSRIHDDFVSDFIEQPGFGVDRIPQLRPVRERDFEVPTEDLLYAEPPQPVAQPGDRDLGSAETALLEAFTRPSRDALLQRHRENVTDFAPSLSLGYVTREGWARGFWPHGFRAVPPDVGDPPDRWSLTRLELVSCLKPRPPAVYVSESLPSMDELRDAPIRPLTRFEARGLDGLIHGDDIVVELVAGELHMVGAIRAHHACRECHNVKVGALLGAFSYQFQSAVQTSNTPVARLGSHEVE